MYGRPLWLLYQNGGYDTMSTFVQFKLLCGWSQPIGLLDFLRWLLPEDDMNSVLSFQRPLPKARARKTFSSPECLGNAFKTAHINFNHISATPSALSADTLPGYLHDLLRESAALQLERNQEDWDLLIPMYFGAINHKFDPSLISAVFIQMKDRENQVPLELDPASPLFKNLEQPILGIIMNLGIFYQPAVASFPPSKAEGLLRVVNKRLGRPDFPLY